MKLAIISDLHVGLGARAKDLCPEPPPTPKKDRDRYNRKDEVAYRQQFVEFVHRERIGADYLVIPGDITNQAQPREVQLASDFVLQAADALQVAHDHIVFAPGNHDVDWSVFDPNDTTGVRWGQRYAPIGHPSFHFRSLMNVGHGDLFAPPHFILWEFADLVVVAYNSASHDTPTPKEAVHHGLADPAHLAAIRDAMASLGSAGRKVRLFLVHHHALDFASPLPRTPDFSLMTNADNLLELLHECNFDLVVHGHKHHPRFDTHSTHVYPHLPILCSGSFSVEIDTQWAGTIDNQFHIVDITGRTGIEQFVAGTITSWTNNHCRGWIPSEESSSGIDHIIPFGSYVMPAALDARIEPVVTGWLASHDHITWRQVVASCPELAHLPLASAMAAFKRLAERLGRKTMYQTLKDLMLY